MIEPVVMATTYCSPTTSPPTANRTESPVFTTRDDVSVPQYMMLFVDASLMDTAVTVPQFAVAVAQSISTVFDTCCDATAVHWEFR